jgi:hypothetical protein
VLVGHGGGVVPHPDSVTGPAEALLPPSIVQFACALTVSPFTPLIGMVLEPEELVRLKVLVDVLPFTVRDSMIRPPVEGNELKVNVTPLQPMEKSAVWALAGAADNTTPAPATVMSANRVATASMIRKHRSPSFLPVRTESDPGSIPCVTTNVNHVLNN